jgi:hypothetical protein
MLMPLKEAPLGFLVFYRIDPDPKWDRNGTSDPTSYLISDPSDPVTTQIWTPK